MNTLAKSVLLLMVAATPIISKAQCACSDPAEGGTIEHVITLPINNFSTNIIKVPKFDPNMGQITCIDIDYTYSLVSSFSVRNKESVPKNYRFLYNVNPSLTVGANSHTETFLNYYPSLTTNVSLEPYGSEGDYVLFGPDTIALDNSTSFGSAINPAFFTGTGDAELIFEFSGGVTSILGGVNYEQVVTTESWGEFKITISWCPNEVLNDDLKDFTAISSPDGIQLNWRNSDDAEQNQYIIQVSKDGNKFIDYQNITGQTNGNSNNTYHQLVSGIEWEKVFVRVKLVAPGKKSTYTPIKIVQKNATKQGIIQVNPNPATDFTNILFPQSLTGNYKIELIGISGQMVHQQNVRFSNQTVFPLRFKKLPAGVYYLRVNNVNHPETFVTKVYISN